jgi:hypothetical protein
MIKVNFIEPDTHEWKDWRARCEQATQAVVAAYADGADITFNTKLYGEIKDELKRQFHGKCAYCERVIESDQHVDVEHYRPKGKVTDLDDKEVLVPSPDGTLKPHPGYYWLAYDWRNLLPSCVLCNQPSTQGDSRVGKRNRFPLVPPSKHALWPEEVSAEVPELLNPMWQDPSRHFKFDPTTGRILGVTNEGRACVEVFGLNTRERMAELRRQAYEAAMLQSKNKVDAHLEGNTATFEKHKASLGKHTSGEAEFALAGRQAIADHEAALRAYLGI